MKLKQSINLKIETIEKSKQHSYLKIETIKSSSNRKNLLIEKLMQLISWKIKKIGESGNGNSRLVQLMTKSKHLIHRKFKTMG